MSLKVKAKHPEDVKKARAIDSEVAKATPVKSKHKHSADPLRRSAAERMAISRDDAVEKFKVFSYAWVPPLDEFEDPRVEAAVKKENKKLAYEKRVEESKNKALTDVKHSPSTATAATATRGNAKQSDYMPFVHIRDGTSKEEWVASDTKELNDMKAEHLLGVVVWMKKRIPEFQFAFKYFNKEMRVMTIAGNREMEISAAETRLGVSACKTEYKESQKSLFYVISLEAAMEQLHKEFNMKLSADDRETILSESGVRGNASVPKVTSKFCELLEEKKIAVKSSENKRLACAGLLIKLWHREIVKFTGREVLLKHM